MKQILIIKLGAIGDVLRTTSILKPLKNKHAPCFITWVTKKESFGLLENNSLIDKLAEINDKSLLKKKYYLVISLDDDYEACELASKLKKEELIGSYLDKNRNKTYTKSSASWFDMGLLGGPDRDDLKNVNKRTYQSILFEILGLKDRDEGPKLILTKKDLEFEDKFAKKHGIKKEDSVIGINTGAGERWELKRLNEEKTIELINELNKETKAKLILLGGPEEKERNKRILSKVKNKIIDAGCNNSLREFSSIVNLCDLIITSDSLALHIALALKKKVVVFFGPTSANEIELYGLGKKVLPAREFLCFYKKKCIHKRDCGDLIEVNDIIIATKVLLKK